MKHCSLHGYYDGFSCPVCSIAVGTPNPQPYVSPNVTPSPVSTEDAIAAMVKAFNLIINDLREQVAERDRQLDEIKTELERLKSADT